MSVPDVQPDDVVYEALTPQRASALAELLQQCSNGCYCRFWHHHEDDYGWLERCANQPQRNRLELLQTAEAGAAQAHGVIARHRERVVGWLKLCPATEMQKLYERRVYRTLDCFGEDRQRVMVVACMLVEPTWRHRGIARGMLAEGLQVAAAAGMHSLEAMPRRANAVMRDDEIWMGPLEILLAAGFEPIAGPDPYPVLRVTLRS